MMKFYYERGPYEDDIVNFGKETIEMMWESEESDIHEMLERIKTFLRALTYGEALVSKIQYLSDDQIAKLHLSGEGDDLQD